MAAFPWHVFFPPRRPPPMDRSSDRDGIKRECSSCGSSFLDSTVNGRYPQTGETCPLCGAGRLREP